MGRQASVNSIATVALACIGAAGLLANATSAWGARPMGTTVTVSAAQLLKIAELAADRGEFATAERAYEALIQDSSQEVRLEARFRLAMLEGKQGKLARAATLLRQVIDQRPDAARVRLELAGVLGRMGDKDGAWRQVRAINAGALPTEVARLVDHYSEALRAQRPAGTSIEFALAPDSNINRATRADRLGTILGDFQITDDGKARSGTGVSLSGQTYRRVPLREDVGLLIRASGFANLYRQSRFNHIAADLAIGPEINLKRDRIQLELGATQRWFGQEPLLRSARAAATLSHQVGSRTLLRLSGSASIIDNQQNDLQDGRGFSAQVGLEHALTRTMGMALSLGGDRQRLREPAYSTTGWRAGAVGWRDLGRMTLSLGAEVGGLKADERLALLPERREDKYSRFSLGATFRQFNWRGFAPLLRLWRERNRSNVAFYDYRRTRTEIGVTRAF